MTKNPSFQDVIVDTGVLLAIFNTKDPHHVEAEQLLKRYGSKKWLATWFVLDELCYHLRNNRSLISDLFKAQHEDKIFHFFDLKQVHVPRLHGIMDKYADRKIDLADASLILLAEHLGHGSILTFDSDFDVYRWNKNKPFNRL